MVRSVLPRTRAALESNVVAATVFHVKHECVYRRERGGGLPMGEVVASHEPVPPCRFVRGHPGGGTDRVFHG